MSTPELEAMVARLQAEAMRSPGGYLLRVGLLAMVGFIVLTLMVAAAGGGVLLLVAAFVALVLSSGTWFVLIIHYYKLLLLLAVPLWLLFKSSLSALLTRIPEPEGFELQRAEAPRVFDAVDDMRKHLRGPEVHRVLIVDTVNAAVVQHPRFGLIGFPRNYLILGLPLLERLSVAEALAVVAHEYAHLAGSHGRFAAFIYRLRHSWSVIDRLSSQWGGLGGRALQLVVRWYAPYFNAYTFVLARANEYQADRAAAEWVGVQAVESALRRISVTALEYDRFLDRSLREVSDAPSPPQDLPARWAVEAAPSVDDERRWLETVMRQESDWADTHPSLHDRLKALSGIKHLPAVTTHGAQSCAAQAWLGESLAAIRARLGREWHDHICARWEARHAQHRALVQRLVDLNERPAPTPDEQFEAIYIRWQLAPDDDLVPSLAAFNRQHPNHANALFLEGRARLQSGDDAGLDLLDRAMALDGDAIKPCCELAISALAERDAPRATLYAERWKARHLWEMQRATELAAIDASHELATVERDRDEREQIQALLGRHESVVSRAWLVRRRVPIDPSFETFLLAIEPTLTARMDGQGYRLVNRLADREWPSHTLVAELSALPKPMRATVRGMADAELVFRRETPGWRFLKLSLVDWASLSLATAIASLPILFEPKLIWMAPLLQLPYLLISAIALRRVKFSALLRYVYSLMVYPVFLVLMVIGMGLSQRYLPALMQNAGKSSNVAVLVIALLPGLCCWAWYRGFAVLDRRLGAR